MNLLMDIARSVDMNSYMCGDCGERIDEDMQESGMCPYCRYWPNGDIV
tara:strand:+ start:405 stop:548 length:144 start_codon:yes stop_codon:yes gene_type:complete